MQAAPSTAPRASRPAQIRTVAAYHGEEQSIKQYEKSLEGPVEVGGEGARA